MVRVRVVTRSGVLQTLEAEGHACMGKPGRDLLCAAISVLIRSAGQSLENVPGSIISGNAEKEGNLYIQVVHVPDTFYEQVRGMTHMLITGLKSLEREFPDGLEADINEK